MQHFCLQWFWSIKWHWNLRSWWTYDSLVSSSLTEAVAAKDDITLQLVAQAFCCPFSPSTSSSSPCIFCESTPSKVLDGIELPLPGFDGVTCGILALGASTFEDTSEECIGSAIAELACCPDQSRYALFSSVDFFSNDMLLYTYHSCMLTFLAALFWRVVVLLWFVCHLVLQWPLQLLWSCLHLELQCEVDLLLSTQQKNSK